MKKKAITFLEILIAAVVMAIAMIPVFGMLSRQTVETDKNVTQAFAINKATEILNFLLDNVSFVAIREGNPGYLKVDDLEDNEKYSDKLTDSKAKGWALALFNHTKKEDNGYLCKGVIEDSKGINYLIFLRVEDIISLKKPNKPDRIKIGENYPNPGNAPNEHLDSDDINFSYLKNPSTLTYSKWCQDYSETIEEYKETNKPILEKQIGSTGVAEPTKNFYTDEILSEIKGKTFGFKNPTSERFTAKQVMNKVPYKVADADLAYCPFKRLIIQIQWNLEPKYYKEPENSKGNIQRVHLMAIKGDIDS